jgi:murein DD-endopeptidase / murein LD-carboxypeptidase
VRVKPSHFWLAARLPTSLLAVLCTACAVNLPRPYYARNSGEYITPDGRNTSLEVSPPDLGKATEGDISNLRKVAENYLGVRYRFGGQSRSGMDCSGFVRQSFQEALGVKLPHSSAAMASLGTEVARDDIKPGDILLFKNHFFIDHAAIYMGQNWFIHSQSGLGVVYTQLDAPYFGEHYAGARRLLP